jgi:hypothetical protein
VTEIQVELTDQDVALMLVFGFARRDPDGVLSLTDKGSEWLHGWCVERLASHGGAA